MKLFAAQNGLLVFVVAISLWLAGQKTPQFVKAAQVVDVENAKLVNAGQNCENWAVAAGLEAMLKQQDVSLDQRFWVTRISGGEVCASETPSAETLSKAVNGEFVLDDGRHVLLELHYLPGAPANVDALIAGLKQQQLSLLLLRGHVYYLTGATYNDYFDRSGTHMFVITELRLSNTFARHPGLAFTRDRDSMEEITALISVRVRPSQQGT
jgi:hypothetical protein